MPLHMPCAWDPVSTASSLTSQDFLLHAMQTTHNTIMEAQPATKPHYPRKDMVLLPGPPLTWGRHRHHLSSPRHPAPECEIPLVRMPAISHGHSEEERARAV